MDKSPSKGSLRIGFISRSSGLNFSSLKILSSSLDSFSKGMWICGIYLVRKQIGLSTIPYMSRKMALTTVLTGRVALVNDMNF
jgi:hypothetical protein